jgi:hypothetical protein
MSDKERIIELKKLYSYRKELEKAHYDSRTRAENIKQELEKVKRRIHDLEK